MDGVALTCHLFLDECCCLKIELRSALGTADVAIFITLNSGLT